ncbi:MAG: glycoside hydrolase family 88 protein [candidate division KSB1 bacterium]|nr:glycoside hydrolase family 88 protein [candidate division KSB1 bacterium]
MHIDHSIRLTSLKPALERAFDFGLRQLERMVQAWPPDRPAPIHTRNGRWYRPPSLWTDWCPGFFAGMMWLAYERTHDPRWRERAERYTRALEPRKFDRSVHDLGFIFLPTVNRWYELLEKDDPMRDRLADWLITAATVQSFRWQDAGPDPYIYSFNGPHSLFIDIMMNIRLLFRAHQLGGDESLYQKAVRHAFTTEEYLIMKDGPRIMDQDGAAIHEAIFNPETGEFRNLSTQQGYSPFTCWSRGLAWAIYGFAEAYRYTGEPLFLQTAERCAGFYLRHTPDSGVPYWDYGAPDIPNEPADSSAAAVAAGGLWRLSCIPEAERRQDYRAAALQILATLCSDDYLGAHDPNYEGILRHGEYHRPNNWGVDESVMWGEYFFMEVVASLLTEK